MSAGILAKLYTIAKSRGYIPNSGCDWFKTEHFAGSLEYATFVKAMLDDAFPEDKHLHVIHQSDGWYWIGAPTEETAGRVARKSEKQP